jgi:thioredoxin 1
MIVDFTDLNFADEVLNSGETVLVDFWAPWCPPCRQLTPVIEQLAKENAGTIKIGKLNIDKSPKTTQSYRVDTIPALLFFKNGEVIDTLHGLHTISRLQRAIDAATA